MSTLVELIPFNGFGATHRYIGDPQKDSSRQTSLSLFQPPRLSETDCFNFPSEIPQLFPGALLFAQNLNN